MILAGLVLASRFRFAYLEQPARISAWFSDEVPDSDFTARYRQLLYDLTECARRLWISGYLIKPLSSSRLGRNGRPSLSNFRLNTLRAKSKFEASLPSKDAEITAENRPHIRSAILSFFEEMADQNTRLLQAALEAYQDEEEDR